MLLEVARSYDGASRTRAAARRDRRQRKQHGNRSNAECKGGEWQKHLGVREVRDLALALVEVQQFMTNVNQKLDSLGAALQDVRLVVKHDM